MALSQAALDFLKGIKEKEDAEKEKVTPKEREFKSNDNRQAIEDARAEVEQKKAELEVRRLEKELERLDKPDTSLDYYGQMLKLQQEHNQQLLAIQENNFKTQLELAKLQYTDGAGAESDYFLEFLDSIKPYIPVIMQGIQKKDAITSPTPQEKTPAQLNAIGGKMKTAAEVEDYKAKIRKGEITEEQAFKDFCEELPEMAKVITKEQFKVEYEKVKNSLD